MTLLRVFLIAQMTFSEGVRARFFSALLLLSLGLLLAASYFQQFDFGTSELKFILDFSFGAVLFFGSILTVVITTQIFFNEIEHRTAISILSRSISRWEFLLGKLVGIAALLFFFCLVTGILLSVVLGLKATELASESDSSGNLVRQFEIFQFLGLQWLKFIVLTALTLCIAGLSRSSLYTMVVSFLAILVCQLQHLAGEIYAEAESITGRCLAWCLNTLLPNLQIYNIGDRMVLSSVTDPLPSGTLWGICLYSIIYASVFFGLAVLFFRDREI